MDSIWLRIKHCSPVRSQLIADLRTSLELTLDKHLRSESSDYRQLVSSTEFQINGRIAKYYGLDLHAEAPFKRSILNLIDAQGF